VHDRVEDGVRTIRFIYKRRPLLMHRIINILGYAWLFRKLIKKRGKPDIIHFHVYLASVSVFVLASYLRIPIVVTEHWSAFCRKTLTVFERFLARLILNRVSIILPVSHYLMKNVKIYAPKTRFEIIPNMVDTTMFRVSPKKYKEKNKIKQMLTVSRLDPDKGVSYLLDALSLLKARRTDFFLNVIGNGIQRKLLEKKTKELDLINYVVFHGITSKHEVAAYMSQCDFLVLPSLFETFGCVIIEAMACGKPVIATNMGGPNEIVTKETGILVPPADAEALMNGINYMLDNYLNYSAIEISNYATERFSQEKIGQYLNQKYEQILGNLAEYKSTI